MLSTKYYSSIYFFKKYSLKYSSVSLKHTFHEKQFKNLIKKIKQNFKTIDVLFKMNNKGIWTPNNWSYINNQPVTNVHL